MEPISTGLLKGRVGIVVGGGPAPGINGVISAATIEAINHGLEVIGIYDGFSWLMKGDSSHIRSLTIDEVSRIHTKGGSILRTSRANPTKSKATMENCLRALGDLGIEYLVTIGGDDTALSASELSRLAGGEIRVAHVPKTIDNDLPLPGNMQTFGFETARHVGTGLVQNLKEDSRTTNRWYFVVAMGRKAGHLALGIGKAAGATITLIGEEFPGERVTLTHVLDVLEAAMIKRKAFGREHGVAVIAEGIAEKLDPEELRSIPGVNIIFDDHGHMRLADVPLANVLRKQMERRFAERGQKVTLVDITLGYELRCADPIPFDCEYVRDLGNGAVRFLVNEYKNPQEVDGAMVCLEAGRLRLVPFRDMRDPETGRTRVRLVDLNTESYLVARKYMIRLEASDLQNANQLHRIAHAAGMTTDEFKRRFESVVHDPTTEVAN